MVSPTWWTWVWAISRSWWWTGKPGVLQSIGSQRVRHDWVIELNWAVRWSPCVKNNESNTFCEVSVFYNLILRTTSKNSIREFPVVQWLGLHPLRPQVWSLDRELRSHKTQGVSKNNNNDDIIFVYYRIHEGILLKKIMSQPSFIGELLQSDNWFQFSRASHLQQEVIHTYPSDYMLTKGHC